MRPRFGQTKWRTTEGAPETGAVADPPTAVASVVQGLRERILSGRLQPGMVLPPERELAGQLAVSRATLREGLSVLSQMGLLSIHRGRGGGAVVTAPPVTSVSASIALLFQTRVVTARQLCEFRRALEAEAGHLAAARRSEADVDTIAAALDAYLSCGDDAAAQNIHGRAFHHAVAGASGNPLLAETMSSINEAFAECFALLHAAPDPAPLIHHLHWPILDAIQCSDADAAGAAMQTHFDQLDQVLRELGVGDQPLGGGAADTSRSIVDNGAARRLREAPRAERG
jgi:GntR family transcriptional repressor for pyruvate dehydrogenase complex